MADLDFYTREIDQSKYIPDLLEVTDEVSQLLIQIENCLFTSKQQVMGQNDFGIDLEDLLFSFIRNEGEIKSRIIEQIYSYCPLAPKYKVDVVVKFKKTLSRDLALINIYLKDSKMFGVLI